MKAYNQRLIYGTAPEIDKAIVSIVKESKTPIIASVISRELTKRGLGVRNTRTIAMRIKFRLHDVINRTKIDRVYYYEYSLYE
jgi:repressor of nif and glnA expression